PVCSAAPCPRLTGCRTTTAPASNATSPVRSLEPSSTTTTAYPARRMPDTTLPTTGASLYAGTTTQGLRIWSVILINQQQAQDRRRSLRFLPGDAPTAARQTPARRGRASAQTRSPRTDTRATAA